jgi:hypothetical protein
MNTTGAPSTNPPAVMGRDLESFTAGCAVPVETPIPEDFWSLVLLLATGSKRGKRNQKQNQEATKGKAQLGAVNFQGLWNGWHHKLAAGFLDARAAEV